MKKANIFTNSNHVSNNTGNANNHNSLFGNKINNNNNRNSIMNSNSNMNYNPIRTNDNKKNNIFSTNNANQNNNYNNRASQFVNTNSNIIQNNNYHPSNIFQNSSSVSQNYQSNQINNSTNKIKDNIFLSLSKTQRLSGRDTEMDIGLTPMDSFNQNNMHTFNRIPNEIDMSEDTPFPNTNIVSRNEEKCTFGSTLFSGF